LDLLRERESWELESVIRVKSDGFASSWIH